MNQLRCLILSGLLLAGCSQPARPPLADSTIGGPFALIDQAGRAVTDKSFAGQYRIMYFGYTYCPDVCPTTAMVIGQAMRSLDRTDPAVAAKVTPVFVTVDPARDTPQAVGAFVHAFYPRFVGLTGTAAQTSAAAAAFKVYWKKGAPGPGGGYLVDHTNAAYLMDPDNKPIAILPTDQTAAATADEIKRWVRVRP